MNNQFLKNDVPEKLKLPLFIFSILFNNLFILFFIYFLLVWTGPRGAGLRRANLQKMGPDRKVQTWRRAAGRKAARRKHKTEERQGNPSSRRRQRGSEMAKRLSESYLFESPVRTKFAEFNKFIPSYNKLIRN